VTTALSHLDGAAYVGAQLDGASFAGSEVSRAYFNRAHLVGADFSNAYLKKTEFDHAVLRDAILRDVHAESASFYGADLRGAFLDGSDVTLEQLTQARVDDDTKLSPDRRAAYDAWKKQQAEATDSTQRPPAEA